MIFCTVHAGKNIFTNITVKSILKFHPSAKIFIVDVTDPDTWLNEKFSPIDDDIMGNVEVISGIPSRHEHFPELNLGNLNVPHWARELIRCKVPSESIRTDTPDLHHTMNIQLAIDMIGENFVLIDNDAPLIRPVNFHHSNIHVMGDLEKQTTYPGCFPVIRNEITRILPYIQFMNVKFMKQKHIQYYDEDILVPNIDCAWFIDFYWHTGFMFPTGSLLYKHASARGINICGIDHTRYVDHFWAATWNGNRNPHDFYAKYMHMFKNRDKFPE